MNKYTLNCPFSEKEIAKKNGAVWQSYNKKWVFFGDSIPEALQSMIEKTDLKIESVCNTCGCEFDDEHVLRQSLKNRKYLGTKVGGEVVQECCEACVQECESALSDGE